MLPLFFIKKIPPLNKKLQALYMDRAYQIAPKIMPFILRKDRILDLGSGTGSIAKVITNKKGSDVTLVDVQYNPICSQYPVIIYDGQHLPFPNNHFSVSLLTAVLHHSHDPLQVLDETIRVTSKRIIIMEDVFTDIGGRIITFIGDCLVNWEVHSPFSNRSKDQWLAIFKKKKLKLVHLEEFKLRCVGFPFKLAIFVLEKVDDNDKQ